VSDLRESRDVFAARLEDLIEHAPVQCRPDGAWWLPQLSVLDVDALFVASRIDWSTVDLSTDARMARGSLHLRRFYPHAQEFLDLSTLDINDCSACVLGQLVGPLLRLDGGVPPGSGVLPGAWLPARTGRPRRSPDWTARVLSGAVA
jgi:hypothetical protein